MATKLHGTWDGRSPHEHEAIASLAARQAELMLDDTLNSPHMTAWTQLRSHAKYSEDIRLVMLASGGESNESVMPRTLAESILAVPLQPSTAASAVANFVGRITISSFRGKAVVDVVNSWLRTTGQRIAWLTNDDGSISPRPCAMSRGSLISKITEYGSADGQVIFGTQHGLLVESSLCGSRDDQCRSDIVNQLMGQDHYQSNIVEQLCAKSVTLADGTDEAVLQVDDVAEPGNSTDGDGRSWRDREQLFW